MVDLHPRVESVVARLHNVKVHRHEESSFAIGSPDDFARHLGFDLPRITKTIFLRSHDGHSYAAVVCSTTLRIDFKSVARAAGMKRVEAAPRAELLEKLDYPPTGVSPLGLPADVPLVIDFGLLQYPTVLIGGGRAGIEIELAPQALVDVTGGTITAVEKVAPPK